MKRAASSQPAGPDPDPGPDADPDRDAGPGAGCQPGRRQNSAQDWRQRAQKVAALVDAIAVQLGLA